MEAGAVAEARLRPRAEADLAEIWNYSRDQWSIARADEYVGALFDAMARLAEKPSCGRSAEDIRPGYRKQKVRSHVIFYRAAP